jgi:predicted methyltransferase
MLRRNVLVSAVVASTFLGGLAWASSAAVSDPSRPAADTARDAARKPDDMLTLSGMKAGDTVLELLPGGGYFTRIFSKQIGPTGHLYAAVPPGQSSDAEPAAEKIADEPGYANVSVVPIQPLPAIPPLDIIWTSQNYHDLHLTRVHVDMAAVTKGWFAILKPGGVVVIVDHAALPGSPAVATADALHRIDPAVVKSEMLGAGFVFDGESAVLANPADPHTANVFDPSIRGKTDQFAYRFRKPQ